MPEHFLPDNGFTEELWYAAHLRSHYEKKVAAEFVRRRVEHFVPVYRSVRRWKDRRVELQMPLFPGYAFVRLALRNRLRVLQVPGVVRLVGIRGVPEAVPEKEMQQLREGMRGGAKLFPHPYLVTGSKACIVRGPLAGACGILIRQKNSCRVVLSIGLIASAASMEVDADDVEVIV
ncbi:MAG TPA: UpxY family transcription antiterminator [Candidatus Dormibacteraeota bacterium]|nr:UpxY family transcription antiterminator [Candidatus Dormibacteraeota bacterium]